MLDDGFWQKRTKTLTLCEPFFAKCNFDRKKVEDIIILEDITVPFLHRGNLSKPRETPKNNHGRFSQSLLVLSSLKITAQVVSITCIQ